MLVAVLSGFAASLAAPWIHRLGRETTGWILALLPLGLTVYFARFTGPVATGETFAVSYAWVPSLGVSLSFRLDGLSFLFALLISGIGTLVVIYSNGYLGGQVQAGRFYAFILMFMASMLGLVLADNVLTLFVFWELTTLSSYLLIGFEHEREAAQQGALQALLVTGAGGLALLVGLLLLGQAGGSLELSVLLGQGETIQADERYLPILVLVLLGAFTKSAQVPFHFWLPNAMEAPTPVSAYLHSATMVKAGIYLLARLSPILAGTGTWLYAVTGVGAATMLVGAYLALKQTDLKRLLAYATVSALGMMTLLLGLGTQLAMVAAMAFLLAHAFYKGALFLVAGIVDHETGSRDVTRVAGLRRAMPLTAVAAVLATLSMAGLPPLFGFIGKELLYEAVLEAQRAPILLAVAVAVANVFYVAAAAIAGITPFIGEKIAAPKTPREAPPGMWLGPAVLAGLGVIAGLRPGVVGQWLVRPAAVATAAQPVETELALWHGVTLTLVLSAITVALGVGVYAGRGALRRVTEQFDLGATWGPERWYRAALGGVEALARAQTRRLQTGYLRYYLTTIIVTAIALIGYTLVSRGGLRGPTDWTDVRFYEAALAALIVLAALMAVRTRSRLVAVVALGAISFGVALVFILFGAPDLAITQVMVDTLTVILFVLVFYHMPPFTEEPHPSARVRDAVVALAAGALMTALVLAATGVQFHPPISSFFAAHSLEEAHGRNIVNVILVDFRGLDTLGEITVLSLAAVGVYVLLKLRLERGTEHE